MQALTILYSLEFNCYASEISDFLHVCMSLISMKLRKFFCNRLNLLHAERPKLYTILAFLSAIGLRMHCLNAIFAREVT